MTEYNPESLGDRKLLASSLEGMLERSGFRLRTADRNDEIVYYRDIEGSERMAVFVYTTLDKYDDALPRPCGEDSIKVCTVYYSESQNKWRGIAKGERRVYRTGAIEEILDRTLERMRECYQVGLIPDRCPDCNAPMFKTKKKPNKPSKVVCAELCWKKPKTKIPDLSKPITVSEYLLLTKTREEVAKRANATIIGNRAVGFPCPLCKTKNTYFYIDLQSHPRDVRGWICQNNSCGGYGNLADLL